MLPHGNAIIICTVCKVQAIRCVYMCMSTDNFTYYWHIFCAHFCLYPQGCLSSNVLRPCFIKCFFSSPLPPGCIGWLILLACFCFFFLFLNMCACCSPSNIGMKTQQCLHSHYRFASVWHTSVTIHVLQMNFY